MLRNKIKHLDKRTLFAALLRAQQVCLAIVLARSFLLVLSCDTWCEDIAWDVLSVVSHSHYSYLRDDVWLSIVVTAPWNLREEVAIVGAIHRSWVASVRTYWSVVVAPRAKSVSDLSKASWVHRDLREGSGLAEVLLRFPQYLLLSWVWEDVLCISQWTSVSHRVGIAGDGIGRVNHVEASFAKLLWRWVISNHGANYCIAVAKIGGVCVEHQQSIKPVECYFVWNPYFCDAPTSLLTLSLQICCSRVFIMRDLLFYFL